AARGGVARRFFRCRTGIVRDFPELYPKPGSGRESYKQRPEHQLRRGALGCGTWNPVIRRLAGYDYDRVAQILAWPVREGLIALVADQRAQDEEEWFLARLSYVIQVSAGVEKVKKPELPTLLRYRPGD
ncbi:MAG TPA: hypothetical protein VN607_03130, partial [Gemmatimonadaceae bacterium]|nr:hypothetical protein [Gemmatimonadaceae bacterium]